jgi:hypothetical protein
VVSAQHFVELEIDSESKNSNQIPSSMFNLGKVTVGSKVTVIFIICCSVLYLVWGIHNTHMHIIHVCMHTCIEAISYAYAYYTCTPVQRFFSKYMCIHVMYF